MPRQITYHEPDAIDCDALTRALAEDFGAMYDITTQYALDQVVVLVRAYKPVSATEKTVLCQALTRRPLRNARNLFTMQYGAMLDCWHQLDRGTLAAAARPIEHGWDGRPRVPSCRKK